MPEGEEQRLEHDGAASMAATEALEGGEQRCSEVELLREGAGRGIDEVLEPAEGLHAPDEQRAREEDEHQREDDGARPREWGEAQAQFVRRGTCQSERAH